MPKSQVRAAVASYLDPTTSGITYLGVVYQGLPKIPNEAALFQLVPAGTGYGAAIFVFIEGQQEARKALVGQFSGGKLREYTVALLCIFKSDAPVVYDGQVAFDEFVDSLTAWIEASKTAGGSSYVFSFGEGTGVDTPDIRIDYPVPKTSQGGVTLFQAVVRVTTLEYLPVGIGP